MNALDNKSVDIKCEKQDGWYDGGYICRTGVFFGYWAYVDDKQEIGNAEWKEGMNSKRLVEVSPQRFKMRTCHSTERAGDGGNDFEWTGGGESAWERKENEEQNG